MGDSRVGDEKLLVARDNEGCGEICGRMQFMSEGEEQSRRTSGEAETGESTRETLDVSNGRLHNKVTGSSRKECDIGSV